MTRTVFYGFGSFVGTIAGQTMCSWWPDDPVALNWASNLLIPIDLSKNPTAARSGTIPITDIVVDDDVTAGGLTEVGPRFPLGRSVGACWVTDVFWNALGPNKPPRQYGNRFYDYELTSVQYWNGELGDRRFFGVHAKIMNKQGALSRVKIWQPGFAKPPGAQVANVAWLDFSQVADPNFTTIQNDGDEGALFIDRDTATALAVRRPKVPQYLGEAEFF
ncbi:MAG: hypothetical protein SFX73_32065 [Kofleriaceae bacterium]|nr:hypothetical protein [Kofleriaceae bacterium]